MTKPKTTTPSVPEKLEHVFSLELRSPVLRTISPLMSLPHPQSLQSSFQPSHLILLARTLESREVRRELARTVAPSSPHNPHHRIPWLHHSRQGSNLKDYYSCSVGQHASHKRKNRYLALEPYDRTRVIVPTPGRDGRSNEDVGGSGHDASEPRYLNANWVREIAGGKWWIAAQAPLPLTAHAFLTLGMCPVGPPSTTSSSSSTVSLPLRRIKTIVQLTLLVEGGRRKAHPYFPGALRQNMVIPAEPGCDAPPIHVYVDKEEMIDDAQCVETELRLRWGTEENKNGSESRDAEEYRVTHLLYTAWPDFGVPDDNHSILNFARLVERVNNRHLTQSSNGTNASPPILVHCSAGVGRTGSFIALSSLLRAYSLLSSPRTPPSSHPVPSLAPPLPVSPLGPLPENLEEDLVAKEVDGLREQRQSMVQREEQLVWVYDALRDAFEGM